MPIRPLLVVAVITAALALAGCTADPAQPAATATNNPVATPTATSTDDPDEPETIPTPQSVSYPSIDALKSAAMGATLPCAKWKKSNPIAKAVASGTCEGGITLAIFTTGAIRDEVVNADQASTKPSTILIGANWLILVAADNDDDPLFPVQAALGGFVVPEGS